MQIDLGNQFNYPLKNLFSLIFKRLSLIKCCVLYYFSILDANSFHATF